MIDPYVHHPVLRGKIIDPLTSSFRSFKPSDFDEKAKALGWPDDWRYTDSEIESAHRAFLDAHGERDLWVFGYASLMWDPGFQFVEIRRAQITGYARKFCLMDTLLRGSPEAPGLQAALSEGTECEGLAFRIAKEKLIEESAFFWRRELLGRVYKPLITKLSTAQGSIEALTVVANHDSQWILPDLPRQEQIKYLATGKGYGGTSREYIENIAAHFASLKLEDAELKALLAQVRAYQE